MMKNLLSWIARLDLLCVATSLPISLHDATVASQISEKRRNRLGNSVTNTRDAPHPRIIGGTRVDTPYPFFALLEVGCGSLLIQDDILLTAAHCDDGDIFKRKTWIGGVDFKTGLERSVIKRIRHPQFDDVGIDYDFMILKLNTTALLDPYYQLDLPETEAVPFSSKQQATTAPEHSRPDGLLSTGATAIQINSDPQVPVVGDALTIMGFGRTDLNDFGMADYLYENTVYAMADEECDAMYSLLRYSPELMLCAGRTDGGGDTCNGDSGGPLIDNKSWSVVGLTSWGVRCGDSNFPGVYSQVDVVADWIHEEVCKNSCYPPDTCDPSILHSCALAVTQGNGTFALHGPVALILSVTFDTFPSEFGAIVTHYESYQEVLFLPYNSLEDPEDPTEEPQTFSQTLEDLPAGIYHFYFGDKARDGICCKYGNGGIMITNTAGDVLWESDGRYEAATEVYLNVSGTSGLVWAADTPEGILTEDGENDAGVPLNDTDNGSEPVDSSSGFDPSKDDVEWPGAFPEPVGSSNRITINIRTDRFPNETEWSWSVRTGPKTFDLVMRGAPLPEESLSSFLQAVSDDTIYKLTIQDTGGNGNCCSSGLGWFTITNATASTDFTTGTVVWAMTGDEFGATVDVFVWIDANGNAQLTNFIPGEGYAVTVAGERSFQEPMGSDEDKGTKKAPQGARDMFT